MAQGTKTMSEFTKSIWIDALPATVFQYFTDARKMARWCGKQVELNPVPGGIYRVDMGKWGVVEGQFVRVDAPTFISHTVPSAGGADAPPSLIEISITPEAGGSRVEIRQTGLEPPMDLVARRGWDHHLSRLAVASTGGSPGVDSLCERDSASFTEAGQ
jgi:uncharacterized protein YndB with AHSA1/START domain